MNAHFSPTGASVIPTVRYRNVGAAVAWLQEAFGLEPHRLVKDSHGSVLYGELTCGTGMVMVAPIQDSPFGKLMVQPDEIGGVETQICYLLVEDAKAHYARAIAAGAEIVLDIEVEANGGRGYSCRDPEGHVWNFGTYDPWDVQPASLPKSRRPNSKAVLAFIILGVAVGAYMYAPAREAVGNIAGKITAKLSTAVETARAEQTDLDANGSADHAWRELHEQLSKERLARVAADRHVRDIREELARERRAREAAELAARDTRERLPQAEIPDSGAALKSAQNAAADARNELAKLRSALQAVAGELAQARTAKEAAERRAKEAHDQFAKLRDASETADEAAERARDLAARERSRRIAAERTLRKAKESPYTPYPLN